MWVRNTGVYAFVRHDHLLILINEPIQYQTKPYHIISYRAVQYKPHYLVPYNTITKPAIQFFSLPYRIVLYDPIPYLTTRYMHDILQFHAIPLLYHTKPDQTIPVISYHTKPYHVIRFISYHIIHKPQRMRSGLERSLHKRRVGCSNPTDLSRKNR